MEYATAVRKEYPLCREEGIAACRPPPGDFPCDLIREQE